MKIVFSRLKRLFIQLFLFGGLIAPRPLVILLDGGYERNRDVSAFKEIIEYASHAQTVPWIVSGSILQHYGQKHHRGLERLFSRFFCFKHEHADLFIFTPLQAPYLCTATSHYSDYELGVGLACEHAEFCKELYSVEQLQEHLAQNTSTADAVTFDASVITSLLISPTAYQHETPSPWVFYIGGHGRYEPSEELSLIVGTRFSFFKKLIEKIMETHDCGLMFLDTCQVGGQQAQRIMDHMARCENRFGVDKSFALAILGLTSDDLFAVPLAAVSLQFKYLFDAAHRDAQKTVFHDIKVLNYALHGFSQNALYGSTRNYCMPTSSNFHKVSNTPQVRRPGSSLWDMLPLGAKHVVSVHEQNQYVRIGGDVAAVLIKKKAARPHIEFTTKTHTIFISAVADHKVCLIHRIKADQIELEDFLRYGFFDLAEPYSNIVFRIDFLTVLDAGRCEELSDVVIIKNRTSSSIGDFGKVFFKHKGACFKAMVSYYPDITQPETPLRAVENLSINVSQISSSDYEAVSNHYSSLV